MLVTGASGFVGRALCEALVRSGYQVRAAVRTEASMAPAAAADRVIVGDIAGFEDWARLLEGVDCVVHMAARVHVLHDEEVDAYFATNAEATRRLASAAARACVSRFVYLSTVKVNGEEQLGETRPYTADDEPHPQDAYGRSKWMGEQAVHGICAESSLQSAIVRSPIVYGPGVRANFLRLMRWVDKGVPMPFGAIHNRRSFVSVWNLCDLLVNVLENPAAANRTWMVSDGVDLSTAELVRRLGLAMSRRVRLMAVPVPVLRAVGALLGRGGEISRLCGSLAVDVSATVERLGWTPPVGIDSGLARTVEWYLTKSSAR